MAVAFEQLRKACDSSRLGPASGNRVVAVLLAARAIGEIAVIGVGGNASIGPTTANPVTGRILGAPLPGLRTSSAAGASRAARAAAAAALTGVNVAGAAGAAGVAGVTGPTMASRAAVAAVAAGAAGGAVAAGAAGGVAAPPA
jgi:hypothetical protein